MDTDSATGEPETEGCPKCGRTGVAVESLSAADGLVGSLIDIPTGQFSVVSCRHCGYSELYRETDADTPEPSELFSS